MANRLKDFWESVSRCVAFLNLEETPSSQKQLDMFNINDQADKRQDGKDLKDINNKLEHKKRGISRNENLIGSPDFDEKNLGDDEKNLS